MNFKLYHPGRKLSRRQLLYAAAALAASPTFSIAKTMPQSPAPNKYGKLATKICIFSKHLQWLDYEAMAETAAKIGFDGVDLTVRPGGHVLPERVQEDLPKAVQAVKTAGLDVPMITTSVTDPRDTLTERILETASKLGIHYYRLGHYRYEDSQSIPKTLRGLKPMLRDLVEMSKQHKIAAAYQNHAGSNYVGAPIWDLYYLLKNLDKRWIGCQFDIRHATVEGGTAWPIHLRLISECTNTLVTKDFRWAQKDNIWQLENCPLGEGMVDFTKYFQMLRQAKVAGPLSLHLEYPIGGAERGAERLTVEKEKVVQAMHKDLIFLRKSLI